MKRSDLWESRFLKSSDLQGRPTDVVIDRAETETLKNGKGEERKLIVYFRGKKKSLVVNMTNFDAIVDITH